MINDYYLYIKFSFKINKINSENSQGHLSFVICHLSCYQNPTFSFYIQYKGKVHTNLVKYLRITCLQMLYKVVKKYLISNE